MANAVYPLTKAAILSGQVDLTSVTVRAVLVDLADYTYSAAHEFLDDVPSGARVDISTALTSPTVTGGVFDSADPVFEDASGDPSEALILYVDTGVEATSRLLVYYDTGVTGLPVEPNSGDINILVNAGGWFSI